MLKRTKCFSCTAYIYYVYLLFICRLLVFSPYDITSVHISIDDVPLSSKVEHVKGPLYVCLWQSELYSTGLHRITVTAKVRIVLNSPDTTITVFPEVILLII